MSADLPLRGIRVLDFGQYIAAPGAGQSLADLGADVIKVEGPDGDQARHVGAFGTAMVDANNRGKRSIVLDLRQPAAHHVVDQLLETADVLLHNFRHGVSGRLGLAPDEVTARFPRLVYAYVTGFGTRGPSADRVGLDIAAQAEFGIMHMTGEAGGPPQRVGFAVADVLAAHALTSGVLAALVRRGRTGRGAVVETSLMEAAVHAQASTWAERELTGAEPERRGNGQALAAPAADLVAVADGWIVVSAYTQVKFAALCQVLGRPELIGDDRFTSNESRVSHRPALLDHLGRALGAMTRREALDLLAGAGIVCGSVRRFEEFAGDADLEASGLVSHAISSGRSFTVPGSPVTLDGARPTGTTQVPQAGQHTREILADLGRTAGEIRELATRGCVMIAQAEEEVA